MFFTAICYDSSELISLLSKIIFSTVSGKNSYATFIVRMKSSSEFLSKEALRIFGCCPFKLARTVL